MEYLVIAVVVGGFGYFLYTRIKKSKADKGTGGGGGDRPGNGGDLNQH
jgi:hypothetical protein